jgi:hypothetical protein
MIFIPIHLLIFYPSPILSRNKKQAEGDPKGFPLPVRCLITFGAS